MNISKQGKQHGRCGLLAAVLLFALSPCVSAQEGKVVDDLPTITVGSELSEFTLHFGSWGFNLLSRSVEKYVGNLLEDNLQSRLVEEIQGDFPAAKIQDYTQVVNFDSGGNTFGFEARWYPGGRKSSFSLGFVFEKSTMHMGFPEVKVNMKVTSDDRPGQFGVIEAKAENVTLKIEPVSFHALLSWDIVPRWRVHPYFQFGIGLFSIRAFEEGRFQVTYKAELAISNGITKSWEDTIDKSVRQFIDDSGGADEVIRMAVLPVVQLHLGVTGRITDKIALRADIGFFNGFTLRGGVTARL